MNLMMAAAIMAQVMVGSITYYDQGVMEASYSKQLEYGHVASCPECIGKVAVLNSENLNDLVYITRPGKAPEGPYLAADCAEAKHRNNLQARGFIGEIDWQTYLRWGKRIPYQVTFTIVPRGTPVKITIPANPTIPDRPIGRLDHPTHMAMQ